MPIPINVIQDADRVQQDAASDPSPQVRLIAGPDRIFVVHKVDQIAFAKMLAKIGYCQAVAQFGLDAIQEVYVLPAILGKRNDIGRWVSSSNITMKPEVGIGHQIWSERFKPVEPGHLSELILTHIHLFAHLNSPAYTVIVGGNYGGRSPTVTQQMP